MLIAVMLIKKLVYALYKIQYTCILKKCHYVNGVLRMQQKCYRSVTWCNKVAVKVFQGCGVTWYNKNAAELLQGCSKSVIRV